ncbi:50S ribosomal protein L6 [Patescibacteria group bacterium]|nr:50S ribosomal protein L6 [Patescibacteria group bacterium]
MSRIGRRNLTVPQGVTIALDGHNLKVTGPKGELTLTVHPDITVKIDGEIISSEVKTESKKASAYWGTTMSLISNMLTGVTKGYEKKLELVGVGYRAAMAGTGLTMTLGFSHPIEFKAPAGVQLEVAENKHIVIRGIDKQLVGQTSAKIREFKKPEPYKGKGIKYVDEVIKRKAGKSGKA